MTEPLVGFAFSQVTPIVVSGVMYPQRQARGGAGA